MFSLSLSRISRSSAAAATAAVLWQSPGNRLGIATVSAHPENNRSAPPPSTVSTICEPAVTITDIYENLKTKLREIERLEGVSALLSWDEAVLLPENAASARDNQKAALAGVIYEKKTSAELGKEISALVDSDCSRLSLFDQAVIRDAARSYNLEVRKNKDLAMKIAELEGRGYAAWTKARSHNDWVEFAPALEEIISLKKEVTNTTKPDMLVYDGIIDDYERGMKCERIDQFFSALKVELVPLISQILASDAHANYTVPDALKGGDVWEVSKQKALCTEIATAMGFDFTRGRFDESVHPFTGGPHSTDVRITTRYSTDNWLEGISGTVHEAGHGLYEQGRNEEYDDLPVNRALCMGVHESQSLFWERMIFQSRDFWIWATPIFHKHFPHTKSCSAEDFYRFVNRVSPGLIRVDADEVTYPMHIILRFEIEKDIFSTERSFDLNELPSRWKRSMQNALSVDVPDAKTGVLQDVHWSFGAFGYFPSYTLGAAIAAQLYESANRDIPDLKGKIQSGDFSAIREYLRVRIHEKGSLYDSPDVLIEQATGKSMDIEVFISYLKEKYGNIYKLERN